MHFSSLLTTQSNAAEAGDYLISRLRQAMRGEPVDLLLLFLSPHFRADAPGLAARFRAEFGPQAMVGCTGEGVIGGGHEVEQVPSIAVVAASLPGVRLAPFSLRPSRLQEVLTGSGGQFLPADEVRLFVLLADPFTMPMEAVLNVFNRTYAGVPVIGGMASGSFRPGGNALLLNEQTFSDGAVGVAFSGAVDIDVVVSQGCRPVGHPLTVTEVRGNVVMTLNGASPLVVIQEMFDHMPTADQALLQQGLFIGRAINSARTPLGRGDFLIRGVVGVERDTGGLVVADYIQPGETVQFHVRDASTAEEDLEMMLTPQLLYDPPCGGLLFSCNGRGTRLYSHPDGDVSTIFNVLGAVEVGGFFCAGELGPIGGVNFLHGHTASLALFRPAPVEGE